MSRVNDIDIEGPIQAEVFVVWLNTDHLEITGPCGAAPWMIELGEVEHPLAVVDRIVRDVVGAPVLVHSTSWRRDHGAVMLSFIVVIDEGLVGVMETAPIGRSDLARSEATAAPSSIGYEQVIEHGRPGAVGGLAIGAPHLRSRAISGTRVTRPKEGRVVKTFDASHQLRVGCACGWEVVGTEAVVVPAVLDHAEQVHNMKGTREAVLANAERVDATRTDHDRS